MFNEKEITGEKVTKTSRVFFAFPITVVTAFGLFVSSLAHAEQGSIRPFTLLSSSAGPSAPMQLVRGHGGAGFHGGFRGGMLATAGISATALVGASTVVMMAGTMWSHINSDQTASAGHGTHT